MKKLFAVFSVLAVLCIFNSCEMSAPDPVEEIYDTLIGGWVSEDYTSGFVFSEKTLKFFVNGNTGLTSKTNPKWKLNKPSKDIDYYVYEESFKIVVYSNMDYFIIACRNPSSTSYSYGSSWDYTTQAKLIDDKNLKYMVITPYEDIVTNYRKVDPETFYVRYDDSDEVKQDDKTKDPDTNTNTDTTSNNSNEKLDFEITGIKWKYNGQIPGTVTLNSNGTFDYERENASFNNKNGTWKLNGNKLTLSYSAGNASSKIEIEDTFKVSGTGSTMKWTLVEAKSNGVSSTTTSTTFAAMLSAGVVTEVTFEK